MKWRREGAAVDQRDRNGEESEAGNRTRRERESINHAHMRIRHREKRERRDGGRAAEGEKGLINSAWMGGMLLPSLPRLQCLCCRAAWRWRSVWAERTTPAQPHSTSRSHWPAVSTLKDTQRHSNRDVNGPSREQQWPEVGNSFSPPPVSFSCFHVDNHSDSLFLYQHCCLRGSHPDTHSSPVWFSYLNWTGEADLAFMARVINGNCNLCSGSRRFERHWMCSVCVWVEKQNVSTGSPF